MTSNADKQLRIEFCKDLCNELVVAGDYPPEYPPWAKALALHMTRLGWTKATAERVEHIQGSPEAERYKACKELDRGRRWMA